MKKKIKPDSDLIIPVSQNFPREKNVEFDSENNDHGVLFEGDFEMISD